MSVPERGTIQDVDAMRPGGEGCLWTARTCGEGRNFEGAIEAIEAIVSQEITTPRNNKRKLRCRRQYEGRKMKQEESL